MRGLTAALGRGTKYRNPDFSVDHLVIGGGEERTLLEGRA